MNGDLFRVSTNVELGMSLGSDDKGMEHTKPRVVGGGSWGPKTPQTPDNMHVPSEGMPTPYSQRGDEWMEEDYSDEEYDRNTVPPPEIDMDRHVRPREYDISIPPSLFQTCFIVFVTFSSF